MKPKLDLNSPITKLGLKIFNSENNKALSASQNVEDAVLPIYSIPKTKEHQIKKTKPEQIGSGVLVLIENQYFIFSATHVFKEFEKYNLLTGAGDGSPVEHLNGERFSCTDSIDGKKDFDASVYHIQTKLKDNLKNKAITLEYFDFEGYDTTKPVHIASGFRVKKSNTSGNSVKSKRGTITSIELDIEEYKTYNYDSVTHILLSYDRQNLLDNNWQISPRPVGFSGGAIIKVKGTSLNIKTKTTDSPKQLLSAITTEYHKGNKNSNGKLIGTRINIFLGLIYKFLPEMRDELDRLKNG